MTHPQSSKSPTPDDSATRSAWHHMDLADVLRCLAVEPSTGLSASEAARRLVEGGLNELLVTGSKSAWRIVWEQVAALMIVILILAAAISAMLGDYLDAAAIGAIVFLNALLGFVQEYRAERAIQSLRKLTVPTVRVRRNNLVNEIASTQLVPGDLMASLVLQAFPKSSGLAGMKSGVSPG